MVFDRVALPLLRVVSMVGDHLRLWVVRAPHRVDLGDLLSWCDVCCYHVSPLYNNEK
jgi:hypothetical protein